MSGQLRARDTFVKFLAASISGYSFPVAVHMRPQQTQTMNALNVLFLDDANTIGANVRDLLVSLDLLADEKCSTTVMPERYAAEMTDNILDALKVGRTEQVYENGSWAEGVGKVVWDTLMVNSLSWRNVPNDSYVHKNLTMKVSYFR